ncbi:MAG: hypothetical protein EA419_01965 [Wenzhouxiangella sp.]|nr:MAG: hypothetical protein EA419_01965 [Wenzhouxiangella sp.]
MNIWLLRHAAAQASASSGRDQDRRLSPAGRSVCHDLQAWIRNYRGAWPRTVLVSPAQRTVETARIVLDRLDIPQPEPAPELWLATAGDLVELITRSSRQPDPLLLIGHNPGLEDLVAWLCGKRLVPGMKPGTLAIVDASLPLHPGCGEIEACFQPSESR